MEVQGCLHFSWLSGCTVRSVIAQPPFNRIGGWPPNPLVAHGQITDDEINVSRDCKHGSLGELTKQRKKHMCSDRVYLLLLTGELADANEFVAGHYPARECVVLSKRELRESGWRGQIKALRTIRGEALIFFLRSLADLQEPQLTAWSSVLHGCRFTVLADSSGQVLTYSRWGRLRLLPKTLASAVCDSFVFVTA